MRRAASRIGTQADERAVGLDGRLLRRLRRYKLRHLAMETLEDRTLLATLPAATVSNTYVNLSVPTGPQSFTNAQVYASSDPATTTPTSSSTGNSSSPTIVVNPGNPQQMVAVWTTILTNPPQLTSGASIIAEGAYSTNGGASWTSFNPAPAVSDITSTTTGALPYFADITDVGVAIDRSGNIYTVASEHSADNTAGEIVTSKFSTSGAYTNKVLYTWTGNSGNQALKPTIAVDNNVNNFTQLNTTSNTTVTQIDPNVGNVYIAWETNDTNRQPGGTYPTAFNPNVIKMVDSIDGGATFTTPAIVDGGYNGYQHDATPKIAISQGVTTQTGAGLPKVVVPGGQVTIIWDDFNTGNTNGSGVDYINATTVQPAPVLVSSSVSGTIFDAPSGGTRTTSFTTMTVPNTPGFVTTNVEVSLTMVDSANSDFEIDLTSPSGVTVPLVAWNQGTAPNFSNGLGGANMGVTLNTNGGVNTKAGTIFDQSSPVPINAGGAPYIGNFSPTPPNAAGGGTLASFNNIDPSGDWTLTFIDHANSNGATQHLYDAHLIITGTPVAGGPITGNIVNVATTHVRGSATNTYTSVANSADPQGIGPGASIAVDNTLGAYSPYEGYMYVAYVNRDTNTSAANPADNTNIFMMVSADGGKTWTGAKPDLNGNPQRINDDVAGTDGFTEGDRPQFQPSVAVDPTTGTVVLTYYDARYSASRSLVAQSIQTSIDGGASFSASNFLNTPNVATDEATGQTVNLGPIPDNNSSGNPQQEKTFGFGDHQGIAVWGGKVYAVWSSNLNGGDGGTQQNGYPHIDLLDIRMATAYIAAGPRILSGTSGVVTTTNAVNGGPEATSFTVTFDRGVDPTSFTAANVTIVERNASGQIIGTPTPTNISYTINGSGLATTFTVTFPADTTPGTVSYAVGPNIHDDIVWETNTNTSTGNLMDQNANGTTGQAVDKFSQPTSTNGIPLGGSYVRSSLPIIIPGPYLSSSSMGGQPGDQSSADNLILNNSAQYIDVTFNQDMLNSSFTPAQILQIVGPTGQIGLPVTYSSGTVNQPIPDNTGQPLQSQILIPSDNGSFPINHLSVTVNINHPQDSDLTGYLVAPNGTQVLLFQSVGGVGGANFTSTVFDDSAAQSIVTGTAPFTGTYKPQDPNGLSQLNGMDLAASSTAGLWTLKVYDSRGGNVGSLVSWSMTATPSLTVTPKNDGIESGTSRTFQVGFPLQQLSGTYTVSLSPTISSAASAALGNPSFQLDQNKNAGVYNLMGYNLDGSTTTVQYNNAPSLVVAGGTTLTSSIPITDAYAIVNATLQLNIQDTTDPSLTVSLLPPPGLGLSAIVLFSGVGATGNHSNFQNTVFDDNASTPIASGGAPFLGSFRPQNALSALDGQNVNGTWQLQIANAAGGATATLTNWSLSFTKNLLSTGLGEAVADQASTSFRIFTMAPTNPLSSDTWTAVGPASIGGSSTSTGGDGPGGGSGAPALVPAASSSGSGLSDPSGRIGAIAVDPSDPSGNTVYIGGASGGVWKTTNFLNPGGPTYIPLTNFGPTFAMNIGGIAVFPRNNDPRQSIIFAATGEGDTGSTGVGVLRSMDGGLTWQTLDSTVNVDSSGNYLPLSSPSRDHAFVGSSAFKISVDPKLTPSGNVIVYMAISGNNGGVWVSYDSGNTWGVQNLSTGKRQANLPGQATDVAFDNSSGVVDKVSNPTGNLQIIYGAIVGKGVYMSTNEGQSWNIMPGGIGDPLIQDLHSNGKQAPVSVGAGATPNGLSSRIELATPAATTNGQQNFYYAGWVYAVVVLNNAMQGVYMTKDFGQNWAQLQIDTVPGGQNPASESAVPTNQNTSPNLPYDPFAAPPFSGQGNYDVSLGIDPTNPNVIYIGGTTDGPPTGLIRVDTTGISDAHSFYMGQNGTSNAIEVNTTDPISLQGGKPVSGFDPRSNAYLNLLRDPSSPLGGTATFVVNNVNGFANTGTNVKWIPFDIAGTDQHRMVVIPDPLTGLPRLIIGDDQGVFTAVDNHGQQIDAAQKNGNLQVTQFYYGAVQPSNMGAANGGGLFYSSAQDNGGPISDPNILNDGNLVWNGPGGDATGVAVSQQGTGTLYQYWWPCCGGNGTDFFTRNGAGATNGLVQASGTGNVPDPQWPFLGGQNFALNPINDNAIVMGSAAGRFFRTEDGGKNWFVIANPGDIGNSGSTITAPAFGAPDPATEGSSIDDFIYAGLGNGQIWVSTTGGGSGTGISWLNITNGALAGDGSGIQQIVTDPTRGSHRAYAVTSNGVYFIQNSVPTYSATGQLIAPATQWVKITGNLFNIKTNFFNDPNQQETQLKYLTSLSVDWRYVIPYTPGGASTTDPTLTHPLLYVGGEGGVYVSSDNGNSWAPFPAGISSSLNSVAAQYGDGGGLPNAHITDLQMSIGNIDPTTGHATQVANDPNVLYATTYGRGAYAIRLGPQVFPTTVALDPNNPPPSGSDSGVTGVSSTLTDNITNVAQAFLDGTSEASAYGATVRITLWDYTNPADPVRIGGFDGVLGDSTDIAANQTDTTGHFSVQISAAGATELINDISGPDGVKTIGIQATDDSGTTGNTALFTYTLLTQPPPPPTGIALDPSLPPPGGSDSGVTGDGISNVANPYFDASGILNATTGPTATAAPYYVILLRSSTGAPGSFTVVNTVQDTVNNNGVPDTVPIQDNSGTLVDNTANTTHAGTTYYYEVEQEDIAGNISNPSSVFPYVYKSTASTPTSLVLDPNLPATAGGSDTGLSFTDGITNDGTPYFNVTNIEASAQDVVLLRSTSASGPFSVVNTLTSPVVFNLDGSVTIQDPGPTPPDGYYFYEVQQVDVAGNTSPASTPLQVLIVRAAPSTPSMQLDSLSDSGVTGDNITNVTNPTFDVTGATNNAKFPADGPGLVLLLRSSTGLPGSFTQISQVSTGATGSVKIQDPGPLSGSPPIAGVTYYYEVEHEDVAGNISPPSSPLPITIKTQAQTPSALKLDPTNPPPNGSDTGLSATDSITKDASPYLNVSGIENTAQKVVLLRSTSAGGPYTQVSTETPVVFNTDGSVTIPDPGPVPQDGYYYYEVQQEDVAGNVSASSGPLQVLIVTATPSTPSLKLNSGSDSGVTGDNTTNVTNPSFDVTGATNNPNFAADGPGQVILLRSSTGLAGSFTPVSTISAGNTGAVTIQDAGPLAGYPPIAGISYYYEVEQEDVAGNISAASAPLKITIKTVAQTPSAPILDPNNPAGGSDTGVSATDNITDTNKPYINVSGIEATAQQVILLRSTSANSGFTPVNTVSPVFNTNGSVSIQDTTGATPDGTYYYEVEQVDVAGNTSSPSSALQVLIVTATPSTPVLKLDASSDAGLSNSDNITNVTQPLLDISGLSTTPPFPTDGPYTVTLLMSTSATGTFTSVPFQTVSGSGTSSLVIKDLQPLQPDGYYYFEVQQEDVAGNVSVPTAPLQVLVVTATPATPSAVLDPASDSGVAGDKITNVTSPSFDVTGATNNPNFAADGPGQVLLLRSDSASGPFTIVSTISAGNTGAVTIQDNSGTATDNTISTTHAGTTYYYEVKQEDVAGNISPASTPPLAITIKTSAQTPNAPVLDPASDSGTKLDNITAVVNPSFDVTGIEASAQSVILLRATSASGPFQQVKTETPVVFNSNGSVTIQDPGIVQPDGTYYYEVEQVDVAGNLSNPPSPSLAITINTAAPQAPAAPVLTAGSNSSGLPTNLTNHTGTSGNLVFTVSVTPDVDTWVRLYDVTSGTPILVSAPTQAVNGTATVTYTGPALTDGTHIFEATAAAEYLPATQSSPGFSSPESGFSASTSIIVQTSTLLTSFSPNSNFYSSSTLPGSFTVTFNHPLAGLTPDVANGTGFSDANAFSFMLIPSGPDGQATYNATNKTTYWSGPSGYDKGDLPLHSTLVYHVNSDGTSTITLTPTVPLTTDLYLLAVSSLTDLAGNPITQINPQTQQVMNQPLYSSFDYHATPASTAAPTITSVTANHGSSTVFPVPTPGSIPVIAQPDTIAIQFSQPMNPYQVASMIQLVALPSPGSNSVPISAVVTYSPSTHTAYVTPTQQLLPGIKYIVNVSGALSNDQGFPNPGVPLGVSSAFAFDVGTNPVGRGVGSLRVTATSPVNGTQVTHQYGYVTVTFNEPISMSALGRYSVMLTPNPTGPNDYTPVNAKLAFNPNTNQLIIVPTDALGNAIDYLSLANIYSALLNGSPNTANPLLNNANQPAGLNGNRPYFATWQLLVGGATSAAVPRALVNNTITVSPVASDSQSAPVVVNATAGTATNVPPTPAAPPTDHVSANRVAQPVTHGKRGHVRLTMGNNAKTRGDMVTTALESLERDRVRPGRWV